MPHTRAGLLLLLMPLVACSPMELGTGSPDNIVHGVSFGMCIGYCASVLEVEGTTATLTETSRDSAQYPRRTRTLQLSSEEAAQLRQLADPSALSQVAGVHGCPDCADGGAEWIALQAGGRTLRSTYEYRANLQPILQLQAELRSLRERFR